MKKSAKKEKDKPKKASAYFLELKSINELARNVSTFGEGVRPLYAVKQGKNFRIMSPSIKVGDARLVLYVDSNVCKNFLIYRPGTTSEKETLEFKDTILAAAPGQDIQNIPVIEFVDNPFDEAKEKPKVMCLRVKDCASVVKGILTRSMESGHIGKVYCFGSKAEHYIGSFTMMDDEDDTKMFCYAKMDSKDTCSFFRYNYNTDKVEATNSFGEHSYIYVRIINLASVPSFFKPD